MKMAIDNNPPIRILMPKAVPTINPKILDHLKLGKLENTLMA